MSKSLDTDELIDRIKNDEKKRGYLAEPMAFTNFQTESSNTEEITSIDINGDFLHSQLLLESLLTMKPSNNERRSLITHCRAKYQNSTSDLRKIDEFESNYSTEQALFWYTQDCFLYRMLNKAFRSQDIDTLYLMRHVIRDIHKQIIEQNHEVPITVPKVYRAQLISKEELKCFEIGNLISMNSFFSTTLDPTYALFLLPESNMQEQLTGVLFEIDITPHLRSAKPFADITSKSAFPSESEILFMAGSIFRIADMRTENESNYRIQLLLSGDGDHRLKPLFEHMRNDIPSECPSIGYGIVLTNASKLEQAERFFRNVLSELPSEDPLTMHCYHQLGNVFDDQGDFDKSLEYFEKALEKKLELLDTDNPSLANTYTCCGVAYLRKNELQRALSSYEKALNIFKKAYGENHEDVAMCLFNIGDVKVFENKFNEALEMFQQALNIWSVCLPENHSDLGRVHMALGNVHNELKNTDEALNHFDTALDIMSNSLPNIHHELALLYDRMGSLYYSTGDNTTAEEYLMEGLSIKQNLYPSDHSSMVDSYHAMGLICKDRGEYQRAVELLEKAVAIHTKYLPADHESSVQLQEDLTEAKAAVENSQT